MCTQAGQEYHNAPSASEVAAIMPGDGATAIQTHSCQVSGWSSASHQQAPSSLHAFAFSLAFSGGEIWAGSLALRMQRRMEALQVSLAGVLLNTCSIEAKATLANGAQSRHEIRNLSVLA